MRNWIANQFRTFGKVYAWWRDQLTIMGKVVFLVMIGCLPTLADSGAVLAIVFIACSVVLLVASATSFLYRPRLAIKVALPPRWMRTESRMLQLEITNRSRLPLYDVFFELLPSPDVWEIVRSSSSARILQPGQTDKVSTTVKALRRGLSQLPRLQATTLFPLQLVRRTETFQLPRQALILPFYRELQSLHLVQSAPSFSRGNSLALQTVGLTGEYVGSREYQPGIPVRKWDYASWARLGQPVVREFSEPRHPSAAVILDTFFPAKEVGRELRIPELEAILSLAAAVTETLLDQGNRIDLLAIGDQVHAVHDRFGGDDHLEILEQLALAEPLPDDVSKLKQKVEETRVTWDLVIVLSHRWNTDQEQLFQAATRHRARGARILIQDVGQSKRGTQEGELYRMTCSQVETGLVDL